MCGIAGLWTTNDDMPVCRDTVGRMISALHHRGPDDQGMHVSRRVGMGMTRLSIIDVSGGHQPISSEDGAVTVVCNGEIYNHDELRRELMARGHVFRTRSDVEVIVHLYEEMGVGCLQRLRGMFGIALWDERRQRLMIARDRLGIKPLFYARAGKQVLFASEMKAIARSGVVSLDLDAEALNSYLTFGYIPSPLTIYKNVRKLDPGHVMVCEGGTVTTERYWQLRFEPQADADETAIGERFLELFSDAVRTHLMSDVSLGAFLSGGVDSSLVVALMAECTSTPVKTFTIGFGGSAGGHLDERPYARLLSNRYGTTHTEVEVRPNLEEVIDEIVDAFDEPFADDSVIPTYYICKLARQQVTVALTGLGGDELFAGYERYLGLKLSAAYHALPAMLRRRVVEPIVERLPERRDGRYTINHLKRFVRSAGLSSAHRYLDYITIFNDDLKRRLYRPEALGAAGMNGHDTSLFDAPAAGDLVDRALNHDMHTYLPEDILALSDRLSMRHALELRVPFLDHPLVEFCASIPSSLKIRATTKKYLLKRVARRFIPGEIIDHRKQGFGSPMSAWLRGDLKDYVRSTLAPAKLARHGLFDADAVGGLIDAHQDYRESNERQLFALMMFQKWHERFM
jgi:asparagine synthase (glutamine-hydrolysing)